MLKSKQILRYSLRLCILSPAKRTTPADVAFLQRKRDGNEAIDGERDQNPDGRVTRSVERKYFCLARPPMNNKITQYDICW